MKKTKSMKGIKTAVQFIRHRTSYVLQERLATRENTVAHAGVEMARLKKDGLDSDLRGKIGQSLVRGGKNHIPDHME